MAGNRGRIADMATGTLITVAPTGAESSKSDVPALPVTLEELVATAKECEALGASVIHVHIRDDEARPTLDLGRLRDTVAALPVDPLGDVLPAAAGAFRDVGHADQVGVEPQDPHAGHNH